MKFSTKSIFSIENLPGGLTHSQTFLDALLQDNLDGILFLQPIKGENEVYIDYIIRYYNPIFARTFQQLGIGALQPGTLLFELVPGLKKNLAFFRAERKLKKMPLFESTEYINTDGLDHWLNIRISNYMDEGFIAIISDRTIEVKEKIWSKVNLNISEMLLKNHYWRFSVPSILRELNDASMSSRVNLYMAEDLEKPDGIRFRLVDYSMDGRSDPEQEIFREMIEYPSDDPRMEYYFHLMKKGVVLDLKIPNPKLPKLIHDSMERKQIRRVILVPIILNGEQIGLFYIENPKGKFNYTREKRTLKNIADNLSSAIKSRYSHKRIEESQQHYRTLVEKLDAAVYKTSIKKPFQFSYINPNISSCVGHTAEEIIQNHEVFLDCILPQDRSGFLEEVKKSARTKSPYNYEFRIRCANGLVKWLNASAIVINDEFENPRDYLGYINDITKQKERDRNLLESQKLESIGRFTGGIAHDLNNRIQPAMIYLSIVKESISKDSQLAKIAPKIEKGIQSLAQAKELIKKILDFSRPKSDKPIYTKLQYGLVRAMEDLKSIHPIPVDAVNLDQLNKDWLVETDEASLYQVFTHVLKNAVDAVKDISEPKIGVEVKISTDGGNSINGNIQKNLISDVSEVEIVITDNGTGLSEEILPHLFDPFFSTKKMGEGVGLGLPISYGIMKKLGGSISVTNRNSGTDSMASPDHGFAKAKGTKVVLKFPITPSQENPAQ